MNPVSYDFAKDFVANLNRAGKYALFSYLNETERQRLNRKYPGLTEFVQKYIFESRYAAKIKAPPTMTWEELRDFDVSKLTVQIISDRNTIFGPLTINVALDSPRKSDLRILESDDPEEILSSQDSAREQDSPLVSAATAANLPSKTTFSEE